MKRIAILGASGHGKVVADIAELTGWEYIAFFDDAYPSVNALGQWPVEGNTQTLVDNLDDFDCVIIAIGDNESRVKKYKYLKKMGATFTSLFHPQAVMSKYVSVGNGTVVMANAVINADSKLGDACIVNTSSSIDHDCILGDGVHVSPGSHLGGGVNVGSMTWVGIGVSVKQSLSIGKNVVVGAGAAVVSNLPDNTVYAGVPAREFKNDKLG